MAEDPGGPEDLKELARALEREGRDEAALDVYARITDRAAEPEPSVLVCRANLQWRLERTEEAAEGFARVGALVGEAGLLHAAVALCERAVRLCPGREDLRARLAELHARAGYGVAGEERGGEDGPGAVAGEVDAREAAGPISAAGDGLGFIPTLLDGANEPLPPVEPLAGLEPTLLPDGLPLLSPDATAGSAPADAEHHLALLDGMRGGDTGSLAHAIEQAHAALCASGVGPVEALLAIGRRIAPHPDARLAREIFLRVLELDPESAEAADALEELRRNVFDSGPRAG